MTGKQRKQRGKAKVAESNAEWLGKAKRLAEWMGQLGILITIEEVRLKMLQAGEKPPTHPNAWGCVFKGKEWKCVGWRESTRPEAHGRAVRVWKLRS